MSLGSCDYQSIEKRGKLLSYLVAKNWCGSGLKSKTPRGVGLSVMCQAKAGIRFHDLRYSYAVYMISKGATIDWVAKSRGHNRETCERYYCSHVLDSDSTALPRELFSNQ